MDKKWIISKTYKKISEIINDFQFTKSIVLSRKLKEYFILNGVTVEIDKKHGHRIYIEYV